MRSEGGYIVNIKRNSFSSRDIADSLAEGSEISGLRSGDTAVYFGHYDCIEILRCGDMSDFFFSHDNMRQWHGEKQSICLYSLLPNDSFGNEADYVYTGFSDPAKSKATGVLMQSSLKSRFHDKKFTPRFVFLSLLSLDQRAAQFFSGFEVKKELFEKLDGAIEMIIGDHCRKTGQIQPCLSYKVLACLGACDIAILWYSDSIEWPSRILSDIRSFHYRDGQDYPIFFTDYTISAIIPSSADSKNTAAAKIPMMRMLGTLRHPTVR